MFRREGALPGRLNFLIVQKLIQATEISQPSEVAQPALRSDFIGIATACLLNSALYDVLMFVEELRVWVYARMLSVHVITYPQ